MTESVDSIVPAGYIQHALLVLNGRCTGPAPEQQLQLQYQLMRAFGRVLGLGWSQTNDNVFTGSPQATYKQAMHWPVMHPIDIICGPYTYQCMPQPFTLRPDDLSAMAQLYYIGKGQAPPGKVDSLLNANQVGGVLYFPTGQGMQGVNVVGRRLEQFKPASDVEQFEDVSAVTGFLYRRTNPTPVAPADTSISGSMGTSNCCYEGSYVIGRVPMLFGFWQWIVLTTEPVNPLYVGAYSVGPYTSNTVQPSGASITSQTGIYPSYADYEWMDFTFSDGASSLSVCRGGGDGAGPGSCSDDGMVERVAVRVVADGGVGGDDGAGEPHPDGGGDGAGRAGICVGAEGDAGDWGLEGYGRAGIAAQRGGGDGGVQYEFGGDDFADGE